MAIFPYRGTKNLTEYRTEYRTRPCEAQIALALVTPAGARQPAPLGTSVNRPCRFGWPFVLVVPVPHSLHAVSAYRVFQRDTYLSFGHVWHEHSLPPSLASLPPSLASSSLR